MLRTFCLLAVVMVVSDQRLKNTNVHVSAGSPDGWAVNDDLEDSAKDLRNALKKDFTLVDDPTLADLRVFVTYRGYRGTGSFRSSRDGTDTVSTVEQTTAVVEIAVITRDGNQLEFRGSDPLMWKSAAGRCKDKLKKFVKANHDKIVSLREQ